jgi:glycolate oxidase iron-sulfur subunit
VLEGAEPTRKTQTHLDRCLTCRNCETTCPSGVDYGHLLDIGRHIVDESVPRPAGEALTRWALKEGLPSPAFGPAMKLGQAVRGLLPQALRAKVPVALPAGEWPVPNPSLPQVLLLRGCVQPSMAPNINAAAARVLQAAGFSAREVSQATCCGAVKFHLNDADSARNQMRQNIDAWWPLVEAGQVHAIVMTASGCGAMVKDYGHALQHDSAYAEKAKTISALTKDLSEITALFQGPAADAIKARVAQKAQSTKLPSIAFHPPCTLQHGQKLKGGVEEGLRGLGFEVKLAARDPHLCCGSAGTYSVLQPELSNQLKANKLDALQASACDLIASANIGCITHLQSGTATPVRHWVEVLDEALK